VRIAAPFVIPECFIKRERSVSRSMWVVYHDPEFQEPWWLLVPSQSSRPVTSSRGSSGFVPRNACKSSRVSGTFKTHLGLRGLPSESEHRRNAPAACCSLLPWAYCLALLLGVFAGSGKKLGQDLEIPRRRPRPRKLSDF